MRELTDKRPRLNVKKSGKLLDYDKHINYGELEAKKNLAW